MKNEMTALQRLIFLLARRGKHLEAFDETDSSLLGYQSFRFVHTLLDYLFGKTSAWVCLFQPVILGFSPFLRVGDLEQGVRVGQKGTAQMFVRPPTTTLELENDREYKIQMETC